MSSPTLWRALSDPTRRKVLDLLLDRPLIVGEIASQFRISRIAVMRHLQVLSEAGLVTSRKRGRERRYYLNAAALQQIYTRWFDPRASGWVSGLLRLRRGVEARNTSMDTTRPSVDVAFDVSIDAPNEDVFRAITDDPGAWWGHPMLRPAATALALDPRIGGLFVEQWTDGGAVLAAVTQWSKSRHLELTGPFHLGLGLGVATFDTTPDGDATLLQFSFRAFGPVDEDVAGQFAKGWRELLTHRLKAFVENGTRLGIAPNGRPAHKKRRKGSG